MQVVARREDPLKKFWWVGVGSLILACIWFSLPLTQRQWEDSVRVGGGKAGTDQNLDSLDQSLHSIEAPGAPVAKGSEGAYPHPDDNDASASPASVNSKNGAPVSVASADGGGNLADALKNLAVSGKPEAKEKESPRASAGGALHASFQAPRANFGALTGLGSGSSGGSGAGWSANASAVSGSGWNASGAGPRVEIQNSASGAGQAPLKSGKGHFLDALQNAQANAVRAAGETNYDAAAGMSGRTYDASGQRAATANLNGGASIGSLDQAPQNLKAFDPRINEKPLDAPKIDPKKVDDPSASKEAQQQQMMQGLETMLMSAAISGVTGPLFSGAGIAALQFACESCYTDMVAAHALNLASVK